MIRLVPLSLAAVLVAIALTFSGCAQIAEGERMACGVAAKLPAQTRLALDAQDPNSFEGIYWAATKQACGL